MISKHVDVPNNFETALHQILIALEDCAVAPTSKAAAEIEDTHDAYGSGPIRRSPVRVWQSGSRASARPGRP